MLRASLALAAVLAGGLYLAHAAGSDRATVRPSDSGASSAASARGSLPRGPGSLRAAYVHEGRVLVDDAFPAELFAVDLHPCGDPASCTGGACATRSVGLAADGGFRFHAPLGEACALVFRLAGTDAPLRVLANVGRRTGADPRLANVELRDELTWAHLDVVDLHGRSLSGVRVVELAPEPGRRRLAVDGAGPVDLYSKGSLPSIRILCDGYEPCDLHGGAGHLVVALRDDERIG